MRTSSDTTSRSPSSLTPPPAGVPPGCLTTSQSGPPPAARTAAGGPGAAGREPPLKGRATHGRRRERLAPGARQPRRGGLSGGAQGSDLFPQLGARPCQALVRPRQLDLGSPQLLEPRPRPNGVIGDGPDASAVLAYQPLDQLQALLNRLEAHLAARRLTRRPRGRHAL